ncbi:cytochrome C biogenesis protein [Vespertiliibacter pulmonis]|uniref:Formate-dependent nitrite reductase complex subunit NrfG n=1 Tax=Vespertiliibacter pulmonis TaxID=1443036 RepID=A0A3N4VUF2_9PAST|nr:cytochrome C biogenesis protein [Vespertiliibacter pulmonis]QLB20963.1 cytochrome C biogenesis protein [Vespertiliibacter pulmonis]RPE80737.1 formate-dependent nitrite reductase complex subunit NrfG [Vespertiliibacter pulmonis]
MMKRDVLNSTYYQQAVRLAEKFAPQERSEFLRETAERQAFEQAQLVQHHLRNTKLKRPLVFASLSMLVVLAGATIFYAQTGRYAEVQQGEQALHTFLAKKSEEDNSQRNDHYIVNLQNQLRKNANNGDVWFELGQAYSLNNDFESAMVCFNNAINVLGRKPAIIGAMATAEYYRNKQILSAQAKKWVDEALKGDPQESSSLLLLASEAFLHNEFEQAIFYWENVLNSDNRSIDRREIIQSIQMAQQMLYGQQLQRKMQK